MTVRQSVIPSTVYQTTVRNLVSPTQLGPIFTGQDFFFQNNDNYYFQNNDNYVFN